MTSSDENSNTSLPETKDDDQSLMLSIVLLSLMSVVTLWAGVLSIVVWLSV
jgi:hypothetical protein